MLRNQKWRYVYARKFGKSRILATKLLLPIKLDGNPDFELMARIVQSSSVYPLINYFRNIYKSSNVETLKECK